MNSNGEKEKSIEIPKPLKKGDRIFKKNGKWYIEWT